MTVAKQFLDAPFPTFVSRRAAWDFPNDLPIAGEPRLRKSAHALSRRHQAGQGSSLSSFPKRENPKINLKNMAYFRGRNKVIFRPSVTSVPPQIHHQRTTIYQQVFAKTPAKNAAPPRI
jgi:hypothetical protein